MNITAIRETVKRMHAADVIPAKHAEALRLCPVFVIGSKLAWTEDEKLWTEENIMGGENKCVPVNLPYKAFIIFYPRTPNEPTSTEDSCYYVIQDNVDAEVNGKLQTTIMTVVEAQKDSGDGEEYWVRVRWTGKHDDGTIVSGWVDGVQKPFTSSNNNLIRLSVVIRQVVARLCYDVMSKTSAVLRVEPKPRPDKGVEWHLSRMHYCILTKKQAMKIRDGGKGVSHHDLRRAAHWRRAHFRTLMSPRYKAKRGQRVPVCEAWIGPEQWKGSDGKIYKVIQ